MTAVIVRSSAAIAAKSALSGHALEGQTAGWHIDFAAEPLQIVDVHETAKPKLSDDLPVQAAAAKMKPVFQSFEPVPDCKDVDLTAGGPPKDPSRRAAWLLMQAHLSESIANNPDLVGPD